MTATAVVPVVSAGTIGVLLGPVLRAVIVLFLHDGPAGSSSRPGCPRCGTPILPHRPPCRRPVLVGSGRCPSCRNRVGPPPGSIEIATAAVFASLALRITPLPLLTGLCWLAACGIALAVIDATTHRLPNTLVGTALIGLYSALAVTALTHHQPSSLLRATLGGLTLFAGYTALAAISGGLGAGDSKLAAVLGTALAWFSWTTLLTGTMLAFLTAALHLVVLRLRSHTSPPGYIPFGPSLLLGTLAAILTTS